MKKFIKLFEEMEAPLEEAGKGKSAAFSVPRPDINGNYGFATAKDFHIRELIGEIDEELDEKMGENEDAKDKARKEIAAIWIESLQDWANGTY